MLKDQSVLSFMETLVKECPPTTHIGYSHGKGNYVEWLADNGVKRRSYFSKKEKSLKSLDIRQFINYHDDYLKTLKKYENSRKIENSVPENSVPKKSTKKEDDLFDDLLTLAWASGLFA